MGNYNFVVKRSGWYVWMPRIISYIVIGYGLAWLLDIGSM